MESETPKGKIVVVDDEDDVGRMLQTWLQQDGYDVVYASGFDALRTLMLSAKPDLITLDVMMPKVDGLQVLKWVRECHPDVGVVMGTAIDNLDTVIEAMRNGAMNYMLKPFNLDLVSEEIERAMERQRLIAENRSYQLELEQKVETQTRELRAANAQLQRQVKELEGRDRLIRFHTSGPTPEQACEEILQVVEQVLEINRAIMYRPNATGDQLEAVVALEDGKQDFGLPAVSVDDETSLAAQVFSEGQPKYGTGSQAAVPLRYQEEAIGVLWVDGLREEDREEAGNTLWRLGQEAALVLWSARVAEDLDSG